MSMDSSVSGDIEEPKEQDCLGVREFARFVDCTSASITQLIQKGHIPITTSGKIPRYLGAVMYDARPNKRAQRGSRKYLDGNNSSFEKDLPLCVKYMNVPIENGESLIGEVVIPQKDIVDIKKPVPVAKNIVKKRTPAKKVAAKKRAPIKKKKEPEVVDSRGSAGVDPALFESTMDIRSHKILFEKSRAEKEHFLSTLKKIEVLEKRGDLVPREIVSSEAGKLSTNIRTALFSIPQKIAPLVIGVDTISEAQNIILNEINAVIEVLHMGSK